MDILFVTSDTKLSLNHLTNGTMLLGTKLLHAGFDVGITCFGQYNSFNKDYDIFISDITSYILQQNPSAVSFYVLWHYFHIILRIAREIKSKNSTIITVLGGPHASSTAKEIIESDIDYIDYVCAGEGEKTVVPFFTKILHNGCTTPFEIPGVHYKTPDGYYCSNSKVPLDDIDNLPRWDHRLIGSIIPENEPKYTSETYYMPLDAGRGCPFGCTYCVTSRVLDRTYRMKSADRIISDIKYYNDRYGIRSFNFSHDAFTVNNKLVSNVCDKLLAEKLDIVWKCTTRLDCISEELIKKMMKAGLRGIEVGVETGSQRMQAIIRKNLDLEKSKKMISFLVNQGLDVSVFFMYGFPEENDDDINLTLNFMFDCLDMGVLSTSSTFCRFAPGTPMTLEYYDKLFLDSNNLQLNRSVFGYRNELEHIKKHKSLFTVYYNLDTPVRQDYEFIHYLNKLYMNNRPIMRNLRRCYRDDMVSFYNDFVNSNKDLLSNLSTASAAIKSNSIEIIKNMVGIMDNVYAEKAKHIIEYYSDITALKTQPSGSICQKWYAFNYLDYLEGTALELSDNTKSELLLTKDDSNVYTHLINFV